jgi:DNA-binding NtrC family response regulator
MVRKTTETTDVTTILFMETDDIVFQFRQCMAKALKHLPELKLIYASDATEALSMVDQEHPDVIVVDSELEEETCLLLDALAKTHPPVLIQTETGVERKTRWQKYANVSFVDKEHSLENMHETLVSATEAAKGVRVPGNSELN